MNGSEFVKSIYLGDRKVVNIFFSGEENKIKLQINCISRVRDKTGLWNFYNDENILNGHIVFDDVIDFEFNPQGLIPNEWIELHYEGAEEITDQSGTINLFFKFKIFTTSVDEQGCDRDVTLTIVSKEIYLEDPMNPGVKIL